MWHCMWIFCTCCQSQSDFILVLTGFDVNFVYLGLSVDSLFTYLIFVRRLSSVRSNWNNYAHLSFKYRFYQHWGLLSLTFIILSITWNCQTINYPVLYTFCRSLELEEGKKLWGIRKHLWTTNFDMAFSWRFSFHYILWLPFKSYKTATTRSFYYKYIYIYIYIYIFS